MYAEVLEDALRRRPRADDVEAAAPDLVRELLAHGVDGGVAARRDALFAESTRARSDGTRRKP